MKKRIQKKIEKIKSKLQKVEKLCHFTMYEHELELSSVRGLCVKHVSLGREKNINVFASKNTLLTLTEFYE